MSVAAKLPSASPFELLTSVVKTIENRIIPLTSNGVVSGSKVFGAAILSRKTLEPLSVATNNERVSPLLHGEINCIQQFYTVDFPDPTTRPNPRTDCIFFATHEPCSLCLSGITWSGFSEFYYLFTYEDSRDLFAIPYDIEILEEVFRVRSKQPRPEDEALPLYNHENKFFKSRSLADLIGDIQDDDERRECTEQLERVKSLYRSLSSAYQRGKESGRTTSSVWK